MSIFTEFRKAAETYPHRTALQHKEEGAYRRITYGEMISMVEGLALSLLDHGISAGDRVAIFSENKPEWAFALFAVNLAGGVAVPLDTQLTRDEIQNLLDDSESKIVLSSGSLQQALSPLKISRKILSLDGMFRGGSASRDGGQSVFPEVLPDDWALLLYTSGTTGKPKGVMLSNNNLTSNAEGLCESGLCSHGDNFISVLPLHHAYPLMLNLVLPLTCGARVTFAPSLKRTELGECVRETGGTILIGVPQVYALFNDTLVRKIQELPLPARYAFHLLLLASWTIRRLTKINTAKLLFGSAHRFFGPQLHFLVSGGARLDPAVETNLLKLGFTVLQGYGLTETSPVVTFNRKGRRKIGSAGLPLPGVKVRINAAGEDGNGQVMVGGPNVMMGYYRDEEETDAVLKDGWLATGDLGYLDGDGCLFVTGRLKEVIVLPSGMNIYPEEVENHYLKSPFFKEMCVLAGEGGGLFALILPDFEYMKAQGEAYSRDVVRWQVEALSTRLPTHKRITAYTIIRDPLPRTRLGKIRRNVVRESITKLKIEAGETPGKRSKDEYDIDLLASEGARAILGLVSRLSNREKEIALDDNLELDLGVDSLSRMQLITDAEEMFDCKVPDETGARIITVRDLVEAVSGRPGITPAGKKGREASWGELLKGTQETRLDEIIPPEPGPFGRTFRYIAYHLLRAVFALYFRASLRGADNIPGEGAYILCANHTSFLDSPLLGMALPYRIARRLYFVALTPYFSGKSPLKLIVQVVKIIIMDSAEKLLSSMQLAAQAIEKGSPLCVFPEGGRSADGEVHAFKKGVGILAKELDVPLVPVLIEGTHEALPKGALFPKPGKVRITIGKAILPGQLDLDGLRSNDEDDYEIISGHLRNAIIALGKKNQ